MSKARELEAEFDIEFEADESLIEEVEEDQGLENLSSDQFIFVTMCNELNDSGIPLTNRNMSYIEALAWLFGGMSEFDEDREAYLDFIVDRMSEHKERTHFIH